MMEGPAPAGPDVVSPGQVTGPTTERDVGRVIRLGRTSHTSGGQAARGDLRINSGIDLRISAIFFRKNVSVKPSI